MDNILFMDFELNQPLTYLNKFRKLIRDEGWELDLFWARDYSQKERPSVDEKIKKAKLLVIRKPLTFLSGPQVRKKLQQAVLKDKKSLLVMYTFTEMDSLEVLNEFLRPFKINTSEIQIIDNKTNANDKRNVVFQKKNKCFLHNELFDGVANILIPHPHYVYVTEPAKILIRGNPSTELKYGINEGGLDLTGSELTVGAYYEETGKMIVLDSTLFLDKYFDFNKRFVKNVITWLGKKTKRK
ncbi:hypothetical protein [[Eubacterium] cellulosolvens]